MASRRTKVSCLGCFNVLFPSSEEPSLPRDHMGHTLHMCGSECIVTVYVGSHRLSFPSSESLG